MSLIQKAEQRYGQYNSIYLSTEKMSHAQANYMLIYNFDAIIPNNTFSYDGIDCQMIKILIQIILDFSEQ